MVLVEHHIKYREIHGVDETIWLEESEHKKLHNRLRRENKCKIPAVELRKISNHAHVRTDKFKSYSKLYTKSAVKRIDFYKYMEENVRLMESIVYNISSDHIRITSGFLASNGKRLLYIGDD